MVSKVTFRSRSTLLTHYFNNHGKKKSDFTSTSISESRHLKKIIMQLCKMRKTSFDAPLPVLPSLFSAKLIRLHGPTFRDLIKSCSLKISVLIGIGRKKPDSPQYLFIWVIANILSIYERLLLSLSLGYILMSFCYFFHTGIDFNLH